MAYTTIDDPSAHFTTTLYTGNGSDDRSITNSANAGNFKPDWLWIKERDQTRGHLLQDSTRGATKYLGSHTTSAENTNANGVQAFETNGFQLGTDTDVNLNTGTYVAWQWIANGGTTSSNSDGDITTTVQTNSTAGFSIITYTGNGNNLATIGHGLGATPDFAVVKQRSSSSNTLRWFIKIPAVCGNSEILEWDTTNAKSDSGNGIETMGSSTITLGIDTGNVNATNESSATYVCYAFKNIPGYSKIGKYTGNESTDGTFVYTGFKPAWLMMKRHSEGGNDWIVMDTTRFTFNVVEDYLRANTTDGETDQYNIDVDILSNGFKMKGDSGNINASSAGYVYMAFAERPFVTSKGIPTTAR